MTSMAATFKKWITLARKSDEREQLYYLLESANSKAPLAERVLWLEKLMGWIRTSTINRHDFDLATGQLHNVRIRFFLHLLERNPNWRENVSHLLRSLVLETSALNLFSRVGMGRQHGFLAEASERVLQQILPQPSEVSDLSELFLRIFKEQNDALWVDHIPPSLMTQLIDLIRDDLHPDAFSRWRSDQHLALLILGARIASSGTLPAVLERSPGNDVSQSPFLALNENLISLIRSLGVSGEGIEEARARCLVTSELCRVEVQKIYQALERVGVSVGLVYTLESLISATRRIDYLVRLSVTSREENTDLVVKFLSNLVNERLDQRTLRDLIRANLHLISRKIVERAGAVGEHYIVRNSKEYYSMLRAGLGGGGIMVITTLTKLSISAFHLPLFFEGVFFSFNYATSFVILQLLGFTLATKQPSATASALAGRMIDLDEEGEVAEFVNEVCRMTRSQFAALAGNLILLVPLALLVDLVMFRVGGHHTVSAGKATAILVSINPLKSFTIFNAAITGVLLWMSSIAAGWFENWIVFRRIPEALSGNRKLIKVFRASGAQRIGDWTLRHSTLFSGNISLGILMGFTSILGPFLGLPLDVRHVTLSSASLTFAASTLLQSGGSWESLILPATGIFVIGFLNFAVSYSLALAVAVRAREVKANTVRKLLRAVRKRFRHHPFDFFFPDASEVHPG